MDKPEIIVIEIPESQRRAPNSDAFLWAYLLGLAIGFFMARTLYRTGV